MTTQTTPTLDTLLDDAVQVDTTSEDNGYPARLRRAYTADTMAELRAIAEAAKAEGREVETIDLHQQDGWALWARSNDAPWHTFDLRDDRWEPEGDNRTIIIDADSDRHDEACAWVCGEDTVVEGSDHLYLLYTDVQALADELPDQYDLGDGEQAVAVMGDYNRVKWTWKTGQNGYYYDTHHYCTALLVGPVPDDDEDEEEDEE
jgi:hypothetical protein